MQIISAIPAQHFSYFEHIESAQLSEFCWWIKISTQVESKYVNLKILMSYERNKNIGHPN